MFTVLTEIDGVFGGSEKQANMIVFQQYKDNGWLVFLTILAQWGELQCLHVWMWWYVKHPTQATYTHV